MYLSQHRNGTEAHLDFVGEQVRRAQARIVVVDDIHLGAGALAEELPG